MLVSLALGDANFSRYLTQNPQRESVEYRLRWVPNAKLLLWPCTFHVFCVDFICVWCPTQTQIPVEYGLKGFLMDQNFLILTLIPLLLCQANLNLGLDNLLAKLQDPGQRKNYMWIRMRISRMWSRWVAAAKNLNRKEDLSERKQKKVRILFR